MDIPTVAVFVPSNPMITRTVIDGIPKKTSSIHKFLLMVRKFSKKNTWDINILCINPSLNPYQKNKGNDSPISVHLKNSCINQGAEAASSAIFKAIGCQRCELRAFQTELVQTPIRQISSDRCTCCLFVCTWSCYKKLKVKNCCNSFCCPLSPTCKSFQAL